MAATVLPLAQPAPPHALQMERDRSTIRAVAAANRVGPRAVSYQDLLIHEDAIRSGESHCVIRNSTNEVHAIEDTGVVFYAVWSRTLRAITTYLAHPREFAAGRRTGGH